MRNMRTASIVAAAALLSGCNLAPAYRAPTLPIPPAYPGAVQPRNASQGTAGLHWQGFFRDPLLRSRIETALANNRDLEAATARIAQARARAKVQDAQRLPTVSASGGASGQRIPLNAAGLDEVLGGGGRAVPDALTIEQYQVQAGISAFELDFWGKLRNQSEAQRRQYLATVEAARAFRLSLIGQVANSHYAIVAGGEGIALAERALAARRAALVIARDRRDAGVTSAVDYDQAELLVRQAETDLADLHRSFEQQANLLQVLLSGPSTAPTPPATPLAQAAVADIDPGLPSSLLLDRPDIRQAEQLLRAADADIGSARAAFFPSISLTGTFGFASSALGSLFDGNTQRWSYSGAINLPLFDGGARRGRLAETRARRDELVAEYQKSVQTAFREVADALSARRRYRDQVAAQAAAVAAQRRLAETARLRYDNGVAIYLEVLDAERGLFAAEQRLLLLRSSALQAQVALYVALGGSDGTLGAAS